ncbi:hypothetical protein VTK73DRAFT_1369 [Phialemonium thermophilum]|uniref:Uncharacterized protein n=1 Tax=Phialemonium thermophilum TaxID=223376 RepID=A0ABR3X9W9_9PEZI
MGRGKGTSHRSLEKEEHVRARAMNGVRLARYWSFEEMVVGWLGIRWIHLALKKWDAGAFCAAAPAMSTDKQGVCWRGKGPQNPWPLPPLPLLSDRTKRIPANKRSYIRLHKCQVYTVRICRTARNPKNPKTASRTKRPRIFPAGSLHIHRWTHQCRNVVLSIPSIRGPR